MLVFRSICSNPVRKCYWWNDSFLERPRESLRGTVSWKPWWVRGYNSCRRTISTANRSNDDKMHAGGMSHAHSRMCMLLIPWEKNELFHDNMAIVSFIRSEFFLIGNFTDPNHQNWSAEARHLSSLCEHLWGRLKFSSVCLFGTALFQFTRETN
jgi:hypothetical protein